MTDTPRNGGEGEAAPDGQHSHLLRIAARIEDMRAEIAAIRDRVDLYGRALQIRDAAMALRAAPPAPDATARPDPGTAGLPRRFEAMAAEMLRTADGFHTLEWGRAGAFRWTGPGHDARFEAWIDRRAPMTATVTLAQIGDPANEATLELVVDGASFPLGRQGSTNAFLAGPIPARTTGGATEIRLRVAHLHWPAMTGGLDKRTLGVAFVGLVIEPA